VFIGFNGCRELIKASKKKVGRFNCIKFVDDWLFCHLMRFVRAFFENRVQVQVHPLRHLPTSKLFEVHCLLNKHMLTTFDLTSFVYSKIFCWCSAVNSFCLCSCQAIMIESSTQLKSNSRSWAAGRHKMKDGWMSPHHPAFVECCKIIETASEVEGKVSAHPPLKHDLISLSPTLHDIWC
jgi:hypothetical protein